MGRDKTAKNTACISMFWGDFCRKLGKVQFFEQHVEDRSDVIHASRINRRLPSLPTAAMPIGCHPGGASFSAASFIAVSYC